MDNTMIQRFLDEHDYDIRKTHNGRWIDQKCTMDVLCLVSDCIVEYTSDKVDKTFTVNDIWYSDYTTENVRQIFSKPDPTQKASNEYDKYFGQPIKLLDAAGVIHGEKMEEGTDILLSIRKYWNTSVFEKEIVLISYACILKRYLKTAVFIVCLNISLDCKIKTALKN